MSEDRLAKYKQLIEKHRKGLAIYWIDADEEITADIVFDWLISELEKCHAENKELEDQAKWLRHIWRDELVKAGKQRRHRKWALKKAKSYLRNPCATFVFAGGESRVRADIFDGEKHD